VDKARLGAAAVPRGDRTKLTSLEQARRIAGLAQDKLARDVVILDMRPVCTYTDYFVICTAWILADYLDVVLHVFTPETRGYYKLEELWGDVPSVDVAAG
jgi:ribosome-associated protein